MNIYDVSHFAALSGASKGNRKRIIEENFSYTPDRPSGTLCIGKDENDPGRSLIATCAGAPLVALATGCELSILSTISDVGNGNRKNSNIIVETELDHRITSLGWDLSDSCVVAADISGTLHLFTTEGVLVFSKKIVAKMDSTEIISLQFIYRDFSNDQANGKQTLAVTLSSGLVMLIDNMSIAAICSCAGKSKINNNQNTIGLLPSLLQDLAVRKVSTIHTSASSSSIVRASCCCGGVSVGEGNGSETMYFAFFDESNRFHLSKVSGLVSSPVLLECLAEKSTSSVADFRLIVSPGSSATGAVFLLLLGMDGGIDLVFLENGACSTPSHQSLRLQTKLEHPGVFLSVTASLHPLSPLPHASHTCMCVQVLVTDSHTRTNTAAAAADRSKKVEKKGLSVQSTNLSQHKTSRHSLQQQQAQLLSLFCFFSSEAFFVVSAADFGAFLLLPAELNSSESSKNVDHIDALESTEDSAARGYCCPSLLTSVYTNASRHGSLFQWLRSGGDDDCSVRGFSLSSWMSELLNETVHGVAQVGQVDLLQLPTANWIGMTIATNEYLSGLPSSLASYHEVLQYLMQQLSNVSNSGEVLMMLRTLTRAPKPPAGFLSAVLSAGERQLDGPKIVSPAAQKQKHQFEVLKLHHYLETAEALVNMTYSPADTAFNLTASALDTHDALAIQEASWRETEKEELKRSFFIGLGSHDLFHTLEGLLRNGHVAGCVYACQRHLRSGGPDSNNRMDILKLLKAIPADVCAEDFISFLGQVVLPFLADEEINSPYSGHFPASDGNGHSPEDRSLELFSGIVTLLCDKAVEAEILTGQPFESISYIKAAEKMLDTFSNAHRISREVKERVERLRPDLDLQAAVLRRWKEKLSLAEVRQLGIAGLIFKMLDSVPEESLATFMLDQVSTLLGDLQSEMDVDLILKNWVEDNVTNKIVVSVGSPGSTSDTDDYSHDRPSYAYSDGKPTLLYVSLRRLVSVAEAMRDQVMVAELVLKLLQVRLDDCAEAEARLLSLARRAIGGDSIGLTLREELQEAMRFLRRKQLAAKYNITDFDPREHTQVRHAVSIISSRCDQKDNLADAISFASDWSHSLVDLTSLYTKALLQQIYEAIKGTKMDAVGQNEIAIPSEQQQSSLDRNLKFILEMVPKHFLRVAISDAVTYLLEEIHELSEALKDSDVENMKSEIFFLTKGASNLTCYYLDSKRDPSSSPAAHMGGQPNSKNEKEPVTGTDDPQYSSIDKHAESQTFRFLNDELSSSLKRMNQLQQYYDIYLSLSDIQNRNVCKATVIQLARKRVDEMVKGLSLDSMPLGEDGLPLLPLSGQYRRACLLLQVNVICFSHTAMKSLVQLGYTCFAMEVARSIGQDKGTSSSSNLYVSLSPGPNLSPSDRDSKDKEEESGLVLDVALTLCSIAAKQAQDTIRNASEDEVDLMAQSLPFSSSTSFPSSRGGGTLSGSTSSGSTSASSPAVEHIFALPVRLFQVSRGLLKASISSCQSTCMGRTLDLFHGADMVLTVLDRMEGVASSTLLQTSVNEGNGGSGGQSGRPALLQASHYKDGILMNPSKVMGKLVRFALGEIKRRTTAAGADDAQDLVALVRTLQQSENHLLAVRALFGSWNCGKVKVELLRQSLLSLSRKLLSSRDLDVSFCVSSLSALPYEVMVSQLKSAVPSIQSDFSRLQTVAAVGEELSHLWEQDTLLVVFQGIQTNARWWHTLTSLGVKVDLKAFQSPDLAVREACVKAIVPELLRKSPHDIELGLEFCRQFDLEPEFASSAYMEMILSAAPTSKKDSSWAAKLRKAATGLEERAVIQCLSRMLCKIHPLDYEKVRYTCSWLLDLLALTDNTYTYNGLDNENDATENPGAGGAEHRTEGSGASTGASTVEDDRKVKLYLDVTTYLAGLSFPSSSLQSIASIAPLYDNVCGVYLERLPVWPLLSDAWGIIDPLLSSCPDLSGRLAPLCQPLRLKRSDFNSRRITALYDNLTRRIDSRERGHHDSLSEPRVVGPQAREAKRLALQQVLQAIHSTISDPIQQVEILQWVFSRERCSDDASAVFALECALDILRTNFFPGSTHPNLKKQHNFHSESSGDGSGGMVTLAMSTYSHLTEEMMKLKCEFTVKQFCELMESAMHSTMHYSEVKPTSREVLLGQLSSPSTLLKLIFELSVTVCWNKQMDALYSSSQDELTVISCDCWSLCGRRPVRSALHFCDSVSTIADALATHCGLEGADKNAMQSLTLCIAPQSPTAATTSATPNSLEGIRHSLIGKLLAEGQGLAQGTTDGNSAGLGEKDSFTSSSGASSSTMAGVKELEVASAGYLLTPAETRRRDDLISAFSIAALILMCSNVKQREQYIIQLDSVMRGRGARVMRRLTARSRFRAAVALVYLQGQVDVKMQSGFGLGQHEANTDKTVDFKDLTLFVRYLYLLAETQEIRISCTESTLLQSLGLGCGGVPAGQGEGGGSLVRLEGQNKTGDARLLARTWLQDDGQIEEVLEITRDLLVVSEVSEDNIWIQYLLHLLSPPVNARLLLHSLTALARHAVLTRVCFGRIGGQVLDALVHVCEEALDRLQQMMDLEEARLSDPSAETKSFPGPHGHWLDVCIALQQSVALFLLVLPLVSARVLAPHDEKNGAGKHPAVENMGKLCRRMLRMRKERSSQLSGQWSRVGQVLESCGSGCLRSCFLRATTDHETVGAIADILLLITLDEDLSPENSKWVYGCVWRMLATIHKHFGAIVLTSLLDRLLTDNIIPPERQVDVLQVLLASCASNWSDFCETAKLFLQWSSRSMASAESGSLFRRALGASSPSRMSAADLAHVTSSLQKAAKVALRTRIESIC